MPRTYYVRSAQNEVIRWRPHAMSVMSEPAGLGYEPTMLRAEQTIAAPLGIELLAHGFRWHARCAATVVIQGLRGAVKLVDYAGAPSGESLWRQWPGCACVDLFPLDEARHVAGEVVRLRRPIDVSGMDVEFSEGRRRGEVVIRSMPGEVTAGRLIVWHRIQRGRWHREDRGVLGRQGRTERIPAGQGAFAVEAPGSQLWGLQVFGFGRLVPMTEGARRELADVYPLEAREESQWDDWPLWMHQQFVAPLADHLAVATPIAASLEARLRIAGRRRLFGALLPTCEDWRPGLELEKFVEQQWPAMTPVLSLGLGQAGFTHAFELRDSPLLAEALARAGGDAALFPACARVAPISFEYHRIRGFLPGHGELHDLGEEVRRTLENVRKGDTDAEPRAFDAWTRLSQAVEQSIGVGAEKLDDDTAAELRWSAAQRATVTALNQTLPAAAMTLTQRTAALADLVTAIAAKPFRAQVKRCVAAHLLGRDQFDQAFELHRRPVVDALKALVAAIPPRQVPSMAIRQLTEACSDPDLLAITIACQMLDRQLREWISDALRRRRRDLGDADVSSGETQVPLEVFLDAALREAAALEARSVRANEERQQREQIARWLAPDVDPRSPGATGTLDRLRHGLSSRVDALIECLSAEHVSAGDAAVVRRAKAELDAVDRERSDVEPLTTARLLAQWSAEIAEIEQRVVTGLQRTGTRAHVLTWLTRDGLATARFAARVERAGRRLLLDLKPPLAELLCLSDDEYLSKEGPRIADAVRNIGDLPAKADLERLDADVRRMDDYIHTKHTDLATLRHKLIQERRKHCGELAP